jgi:ectoine hydroxylase-related dioxygenase (phytanoyl-CoA dioxygenase family)
MQSTTHAPNYTHSTKESTMTTFALADKRGWTDHYVDQGFCVIKEVVGSDFIEPAIEEIRGRMEHRLPLREWTTQNTATRLRAPAEGYRQLPLIYDQPGIRTIIETMFGVGEWNEKRHFQVFITPYDESIETPAVSRRGHVDFVRCPIPVFGSGFVFQVSLVQSEPFSGNITIYPGSHKKVQRALAQNPDLQYAHDEVFDKLLDAEPFEFVAAPGDVLLFHHLVGHSGNSNHAVGRSPRLGLHCQANRKSWLREIDPGRPDLTPWERSLSFTGGPYRTRRDEEEWVTEFAKTRTTKPKLAEAYK